MKSNHLPTQSTPVIRSVNPGTLSDGSTVQASLLGGMLFSLASKAIPAIVDAVSS